MWTYLTQPFTFTLPGFETAELEPWDEAGQRWRRLRVTWPSYLATHSAEQTLYFTDDGLLARHDYDVEINGGNRRGGRSLQRPCDRSWRIDRSLLSRGPGAIRAPSQRASRQPR